MHGSASEHTRWHLTRHRGNLACLPDRYSLFFASSSISLGCAFKLTCGSQAKSGWGAQISGSCWSRPGAQQGCRKKTVTMQTEVFPPWTTVTRAPEGDSRRNHWHLSPSSCVSTPWEHISNSSLRLRGRKWPMLKMPLCSSQPVIPISVWKVVGPNTKSVSSVYLMTSCRNIWPQKGEMWPLYY